MKRLTVILMAVFSMSALTFAQGDLPNLDSLKDVFTSQLDDGEKAQIEFARQEAEALKADLANLSPQMAAAKMQDLVDQSELRKEELLNQLTEEQKQKVEEMMANIKAHHEERRGKLQEMMKQKEMGN